MLFDRDAEVEAALLAAVRNRPDGGSLVSVFRAHTRSFWTRFGTILQPGPLPPSFWEIVERSPTLRDYLEATFARHARVIAHQLATERNLPEDDPICHAQARALCGIKRCDPDMRPASTRPRRRPPAHRLRHSCPGRPSLRPARTRLRRAEVDVAFDAAGTCIGQDRRIGLTAASADVLGLVGDHDPFVFALLPDREPWRRERRLQLARRSCTPVRCQQPRAQSSRMPCSAPSSRTAATSCGEDPDDVRAQRSRGSHAPARSPMEPLKDPRGA